MLNAIKKLLRISTDEPVHRWSPAGLDNTRQYLEGKAATEWTHEDHYLAVEYTFQRYLPAEDSRTESEYRSALARLNRKIDWNIANPDAPKEAPVPDSDFAKWMEAQYEERFGQSMRR